MDRESMEDLFQPFGSVAVRRMFGAFGIFADGVMFGLYGRGKLFLKADENTALRFAEAGSQAFLYERGEKTISLGYWTIPDAALDDSDELISWSRLALEAARRKKAGATKKRSGTLETPPTKKRAKQSK